MSSGAPETIRTSDPCLRRAVLYPTELRARGGRIVAGFDAHCHSATRTCRGTEALMTFVADFLTQGIFGNAHDVYAAMRIRGDIRCHRAPPGERQPRGSRRAEHDQIDEIGAARSSTMPRGRRPRSRGAKVAMVEIPAARPIAGGGSCVRGAPGSSNPAHRDRPPACWSGRPTGTSGASPGTATPIAGSPPATPGGARRRDSRYRPRP